MSKKYVPKKILKDLTKILQRLVLPFEVLGKWPTPALILLDKATLFILVNESVKSFLKNLPKNFKTKELYTIACAALDPMSLDELCEFFKRQSVPLDHRHMCLWITRERVRMIIGQRLQDSLFGKVFAEFIKNPSDTVATEKMKHALARVYGLPKGLKKALVFRENKTILKPKRGVEQVFSGDDIREDAIEAILRCWQDLQVKAARPLLAVLWATMPKKPVKQLSLNEKKWARESWVWFHDDIQATRKALLPILEMQEHGPRAVHADYTAKQSGQRVDRQHVKKSLDSGKSDRTPLSKELSGNLTFSRSERYAWEDVASTGDKIEYRAWVRQGKPLPQLDRLIQAQEPRPNPYEDLESLFNETKFVHPRYKKQMLAAIRYMAGTSCTDLQATRQAGIPLRTFKRYIMNVRKKIHPKQS